MLAEACGIDIEQLEAQLRAPRQAGLIQAAPDTRQDGEQRLQFVHGLYRERLIDDLPPERRAALHLRVAQALLRRRAAGHLEAEEPLARHLLAAGAEGDPRLAVEWAVRAGRTALAALAFDRAVELFEGALAACDPLASEAPGPAAGQRIDIELELAEALVRVGAGVRSRALCLAAADQARARGDAVRLARAALAYGAELRPAVVDATLVSLLREGAGGAGRGRTSPARPGDGPAGGGPAAGARSPGAGGRGPRGHRPGAVDRRSPDAAGDPAQRGLGAGRLRARPTSGCRWIASWWRWRCPGAS